MTAAPTAAPAAVRSARNRNGGHQDQECRYRVFHKSPPAKAIGHTEGNLHLRPAVFHKALARKP